MKLKKFIKYVRHLLIIKAYLSSFIHKRVLDTGREQVILTNEVSGQVFTSTIASGPVLFYLVCPAS